MGRLYPAARFEGGDVVVPHEINAELQNVIGEVNGRIDRDNFAIGVLPADRVDIGAYGAFYFESGDTLTSIVVSTTSRAQFHPIPSGGGVGTMFREDDFDDGFLVMSCGITLEDNAAPLHLERQAAIVLLVDGGPIAVSPPSALTATTNDRVTLYARAYTPIGAGFHRVEPRLITTNFGTYTARGRHFFVRHGRR